MVFSLQSQSAWYLLVDYFIADFEFYYALIATYSFLIVYLSIFASIHHFYEVRPWYHFISPLHKLTITLSHITRPQIEFITVLTVLSILAHIFLYSPFFWSLCSFIFNKLANCLTLKWVWWISSHIFKYFKLFLPILSNMFIINCRSILKHSVQKCCIFHQLPLFYYRIFKFYKVRWFVWLMPVLLFEKIGWLNGSLLLRILFILLNSSSLALCINSCFSF